jgi:outer membrane protein assembly factor BamB
MTSVIRTRFLGVVVLLAGVFAASVGAEDWTQWRGDDRLGVWHDEGILKTFPDDGLEVVWRSPIGPGYAGPAVAAGRVFVLDWEKTEGTRAMEGTERVVALDEATGKVLWEQSWSVGYGRLMTSYAIGPRATPTVDGDRLYVVGAVGDLVALDSKSGEVLWHHDFVEEYDALIPTWGVTSAPFVDGDLVISVAGAEPNGKFIAYDKLTGEERWRALSSDWEMGYGQPVLFEIGGKRQLIIWDPRYLNSLDPRTGEIFWQQEFDVGGGMSVTTPVLGDDGMLLVSQFYKGSMMMELNGDKPEARMLWKGKSNSEMPGNTDGLHSLITTPILEGDTIYGVGSYGELRALDAASGERLWLSDAMTRQGRWGTAFFVKNGDRYFVNNDEGDLIIARFSREGYEEVDRTRLIEPTSSAGFGPRKRFDARVNWSHPAYANGHIVARNDKEILRASLLQK